MTDVLKVYKSSGELVFDVDDPGGSISPTPPIELPEGVQTFAFAEIPEVVFVSGYTDDEEMNLYHLDTQNLFPSGSMPWDGDDGFVPRLKCDVVGILPTGVTWDRDNGKFNYDGTVISSHEIQSLTFHQPDADITSDSFELKLLKPSLEWSYSENGESLENAVNAVLPDASGYNVIFIKSGEYQQTQLRDVGNGFMNCFIDIGNIYLIGEPGTMPKLGGTCYDWDNIWSLDPLLWNTGESLRLRMEGTTRVHIRGIDLRFAYFDFVGPIEESLEYLVFNKLKFHSTPNGGDGTQFTYYYTSDPAYLPKFVSNFETYWRGGNGTEHAIYNHAAPKYSTSGLAENPKSITFLNNYKAYEMRRVVDLGSDPQGGQMYKDFGNLTKIRNSFFSMTKDPTNIENMTELDWLKVGSPTPLVLHAHQSVTMFNCELHGWQTDTTSNQPDYSSTGKKLYRGVPSLLNFQNRGLSPLVGAAWPAYFSFPDIGAEIKDECTRFSAYSSWENWEFLCSFDNALHPAQKNSGYHDANSTNNYSETGSFGDVNPNPNRSPTDAAFWDTINDPGNPTTTNAFQKYISYCRFNFYNTVPYSLEVCNAVQVHSSVPKDAKGQFNDVKDYMSCPPNWTERNYVFTCNNTFNGFGTDSRLVTYLMGKREASRYIYPYAPDQVNVVENNKTDAGGDIVDGVGDHVATPIWFKI